MCLIQSFKSSEYCREAAYSIYRKFLENVDTQKVLYNRQQDTNSTTKINKATLLHNELETRKNNGEANLTIN